MDDHDYEQQQALDEMRRREEEELAESLRIAAYADYHIKRGTGTWRDWERSNGADEWIYSGRTNSGRY
jgi:hypothetical protein